MYHSTPPRRTQRNVSNAHPMAAQSSTHTGSVRQPRRADDQVNVCPVESILCQMNVYYHAMPQMERNRQRVMQWIPKGSNNHKSYYYNPKRFVHVICCLCILGIAWLLYVRVT